MRFLLLFTCITLFTTNLGFSQEIYHKAKIWFNNHSLEELAELGLDIDHGVIKEGTFIISDFSVGQIHAVQNAGYSVDVIIEDVATYYATQNATEIISKNANCSTNGVGGFNPTVPANFELGSYAGYFTTQEMFDNLSSMLSQYPNLITDIIPISDTLTHEGRTMYYLRISNNPNTVQNKPRVLYTSLIHSREPGSLSETLFFMWYVLENYGTDPEVTYLVDNVEMYFVPMINPDGYARNETTNPNGGGMHRKNRNPAHGTTNMGVDLNRNFSYQWGTTGVSTNQNNDTYPGTGPFSEPETQNMKKIAEQFGVSFAFNAHTYSNLLLYPIGATAAEFAADDDYFSAYSSHMAQYNGYAAIKSSGLYPASGDSDDYMYVDHGIFAVTPEVGSNFWSPSNQILGDCIDMLFPNLVMAHLPLVYGVATETDSGSSITDMTGDFNHDIIHLGRELGPLELSITPISGIQTVGNSITYNLQILEQQTGDISYELESSIAYGDEIKYVLNVDNGLWIKHDTIVKQFGSPTLQFTDDATTANNWTGDFALTTEDFISPTTSFTDSPNSNYSSNSFYSFVLNDPIDLTEAEEAMIRFYAKWEIESGWDYAQFQVSIDNGQNWIAQCGNYTKPGVFNNGGAQPVEEPLYDGFQSNWVLEEINLSDYLGEEIRVRFVLESDGYVQEDGFYFDDFEVLYNLDPTANLSENFLENIKLVPNPAHAIAHVSFPSYVESGVVSIHDAAGNHVQSITVNHSTNLISIDVNSLNQGVYFVRYSTVENSSNPLRLVVIK
jgi:hypothetical protein